jgi:hypothetical protein
MKYILIYVLCVVGVIALFGLMYLLGEYLCRAFDVDISIVIGGMTVILLAAAIPFVIILRFMGVIE